MSYIPTFPGEGVTPQWLYDELQRIASEMYRPTASTYETLHVAPERPQEGMVATADGTDWNPGAGAGIYQYRAGAWNRLG